MYKIITDSSANLPDSIINSYNLDIITLTIVEGTNSYISYQKGINTDSKKFYDLLRKKVKLSSSCPNIGDADSIFEPLLEEGYDILYLGFSGKLSNTYSVCSQSLKQLNEKYKERKCLHIDTKAASLGQGLIVIEALKKQKEGLDLQQNYDYVQSIIQNVAHYFTVDSLFWLNQGGRISKTSMLIGNILMIKPILHVDAEGFLVPIDKVLGRKKSILTLKNQIVNSIINKIDPLILITHGDCIEEAEALQNEILKEIPQATFIVNLVDVVIGCHSGPGTLAIFAICDHR